MSTVDPGAPARPAAIPPMGGSVALVPLVDATRRLAVAAGTTAGARPGFMVVFGIGYAALAAICVASFLEPWIGWGAVSVYLLAGMCLFVAGLFVAVRTLWKPTERKFRQALAAVAALVVVLVSTPARMELGREVFATSRVPALQPLADELLRQRAIEVVGVRGGRTVLNEYSGDSYSGMHARAEPTAVYAASAETPPAPERRSLDDVLRLEGISRPEYDRVAGGLRAAGMDQVRVQPGRVEFKAAASPGLYLVYAQPGGPLPLPGELVTDAAVAQRTPLGDGWYLVRTRLGWD
jgi:hypothetical protein